MFNYWSVKEGTFIVRSLFILSFISKAIFMYDILQLNQKTVADLKEIAKELDIKKYQKLKKEDYFGFASKC